MRIGITTALCLGLSGAALAESPDHALQVGLDIAAQAVRDDTLVPLAHGGLRPSLSPRYFGDLETGMLLADGRLGLGYVVSSEGEEGATFTWGLHAAYLFYLNADAAEGLAVGPALGWDNETFYLGDWDDAHTYWIGAMWLGPRARWWRRLDESWRLDIDGQIGVIGLLSRPPEYRKTKQETSYDIPRFYAWPTRDLKPAWIGNFQVARISLDFYNSRSTSRVPTGLGLGTEIGFLRASNPDQAFSVEASLRISYSWGL